MASRSHSSASNPSTEMAAIGSGKGQPRKVKPFAPRVGGDTALGILGVKQAKQETPVKPVEVPSHCIHCSLMRDQLAELEARLENAEEALQDERRHCAKPTLIPSLWNHYQLLLVVTTGRTVPT